MRNIKRKKKSFFSFACLKFINKANCGNNKIEKVTMKSEDEINIKISNLNCLNLQHSNGVQNIY